MTDTVRGNLIDAINELSKLLDVTQDPNEQFEIRIKLRELYQRLDRVVVADLSSVTTTVKFRAAIDALKALTEAAKEAQRDVAKVSKAIRKAASAVGKVEKLVSNVAGTLPLI